MLASFLGISLYGQNEQIDSLKKVLSETNEEELKAEILVKLSSHFNGTNDSLALEYANNAVELSKKIQHVYGVGEGYRAIGNVYYFQGKYRKAFDPLEKALAAYKAAGNRKKESAVFNDLGLMNHYLGHPDKALELIQESLAIDEALNDTAGMAGGYSNLAMILQKENRIFDAIDNIEKVLVLDSLTKDWAYYVQDLGNIAQLYKTIQQHETALEYALRGYAFADSIGSVMGAYQNSSVIGDVYQTLGNYQNSLEYLNKSLLKAKEIKKADVISSAFARLQLTYQKMNNTASALSYFDSALVYAPPVHKTDLFNNIGQFYEGNLERPDSALIFYNKAIDNAEKISQPSLKVDPLLNKAFLFGRKKDYGRAINYIEEAIDISANVDKPILVNNLKKIGDIYAKSKNYQTGYKYLLDASTIQDSLLIIEQKAQVKLYTYEQQLRELQIKQQESEIRESKQKLRQRTIIIFLLSIISVLAFLVGYLIYNKNQELKKLNEKLEYLSNEIHHRVKNDFQSVSSMLFIQMDQVDDPSIKQVLLGVRDRILAMGQIHMLFYKEGGYTKMGLGNYFKALIKNRMQSIGSQFREAEVHLEMNIALDEMTKEQIGFNDVKQLGIVINELVTNAYKYAFNNNEKPILIFNAIRTKTNDILIEVIDNGANPAVELDLVSAETFGLKMVKLICNRSKWNFTFKRKENQTVASISIPNKK